MFSESELSLINAYADTLISWGIWGEVEVLENMDDEMPEASACYISRPFSGPTDSPMVLQKVDGRFTLRDSNSRVIAEGETMDDVLQPWAGLYERLSA